MARYLVTGASGFIGSNLAVFLSEKNDVTGLCNSTPGSEDNLLDFKGKFLKGDIRTFDYHSLGKFDAVFHQAAITDTTVTDKQLMYSTNVEAFVKILEYARSTGCRKVVYASSAATYGKGKVPMSEKDTSAPANIYGESKVEMESAAKKFAEGAPEMSLVGLRYFNVYGPHEVHKIKAASMIYQLYSQILSGKAPRVFKWGDQFRDFIYVKDVVLANLKALEFSEHGAFAFNVGTGIPTSFNQVIEVLNSALGANKSTDYFDNPYDFYQEETQADMAYSESILKFRCQFSPESGIRDYVKILAGADLKPVRTGQE
jgi:ADP-L-glycero-D-manno-heptose 6-epimerase